MPRDLNGNYTLPAGNPVVAGTIIAATWANPTMGDIANELTDSLSRSGLGGMLAPFLFTDGTAIAPAMAFTSEPSLGFFRAGPSDLEATVAGVPRMRWVGTGVQIWDSVAAAWFPLSDGSGLNIVLTSVPNVFLFNQTIQNATGQWVVYKDATPTKGARFGLDSTFVADSAAIGHWDGAVWRAVFTSDGNESNYAANVHIWRTSVGVVRGFINAGGWNLGPVVYVPVSGGTVHYAAVTRSTIGVAALGSFVNDGVVNPRAELFTYSNGAVGIIGLDWVFNTAVDRFEFRRANTEIFSYNDAGVLVSGGLQLGLKSFNGTILTTVQADDAGLTFWGTNGANGYQWLINSVLKLSLDSTHAILGQAQKLAFQNAGGGNSRVLLVGAADIQVESGALRGAVLHHELSTMTTGIVVTSNVTPGAAGLVPGTVYLVHA